MLNNKGRRFFDIAIRIVIIYIILYTMMPWRFASHYDYVEPDDIVDMLVEQVTRNISLQQVFACDYRDIIVENAKTFKSYNRDTLWNSDDIQFGGEFYPDECRARFSTAIIVPYRQREQQLHQFLIYMHNYLRKQRIHYRIFLIEQYDLKPFNRAKLFNIGAMVAAEYGFPCLILHDVDLLPLRLGQLYVCTKLPRHCSSALDDFRYNLPYTGLFGGVVAIRTEQFISINGLSNLYEGWGGEDDDFFRRLLVRGISICRFAPTHSEYTMLKHKKQKPNENRLALLRNSSLRIEKDGLSSLTFEEKEHRMHSLFTHILVET